MVLGPNAAFAVATSGKPSPLKSATTDCTGAPDALVTSASPKLCDTVFGSSAAVPRSVLAVMSVKSTVLVGAANPKPLTLAVKS